MLWHARFHTTLKYVTAPKQLTAWCCASPSQRLLSSCCNVLSGRDEDVSDDEEHGVPHVSTIESGGVARAPLHSKAELSV